MDDKQKIITKFNKDISRVMEYVLRGEEMQARYIFNTELLEEYSEQMQPESVLYFATELWITLDEYFNNDGARLIQSPSTDKNYLISIYKDYQEDFKKIRGES